MIEAVQGIAIGYYAFLLLFCAVRHQQLCSEIRIGEFGIEHGYWRRARR